MGGVRNIMVRAGADFSELSNAMRNAQSEAQGFGSNMESIFTRIGHVGEGIKMVFEGITHAVEGIGEFAKESGELDGRLSSLNMRLGDSANSFLQWGDTVGKSIGLSKQYIIEEGASLSAMLMTQASSQKELATKTETMMKNIAIVSSATGKSQTEVSDMIVSALAGHGAAVRALDLNVMESSIIHTQAYKQIAGNAPWAKLTQQQKESIMYTELNAQIAQKFGTTVVDDVATRMNIFTSSLSDVKTNLEQAFQPILYRVLPILSTFINYINTALGYVTAFFQVLFGYSGAQVKGATGAINDQANAVGNLANAHQKLNSATGARAGSSGTGSTVPKVKTNGIGGGGSTSLSGGKKVGTGFVASFDQVHTVPEKTDSGGSGAGKGAGAGGAGAGAGVGAGGVPDIGNPMVAGANKAGQAMDGLRSKVAEWFDSFKKTPIFQWFSSVWNDVSIYFKRVIAQLSIWWFEHGDSVIKAFQNIWNMVKPIIMWLAKFIWDSIKGAIDGIIQFFEGLMEFISGIFTGNWKEAFDGIWKMISGFIEAVWNIFNLTLFGGIKKLLLDLVVSGASAFIKLAEVFKKPLGDFFIWLVKGAMDGIKGVTNFFSDFGSWLERNAVAWAHGFDNFFSGIVNAGWGALNGLKSIFGGLYDWFMRSLVSPLTSAFSNIANGVGGSIMGGLKAIWNQIADNINSAIGFINGVLGAVHGPQIGWTAPHMFAKGGIVTGATNAIVGEAGTEVIQPLSALQGMVASTVAQTINTVMSMQKGNRGNVGGDIILNIDGKQFARIIKPYTDLENKRVGTNVRLQSL